MMTDHDPIGYELTDEGADPDSHLYPVDSRTRTCCGGIGVHGPDCTTPAPVGPYDPEDGQRTVVAYIGMGLADDPHLVGVWAQQDAAGTLSEVAIHMHEPSDLSAEQAREVAGLLLRAADTVDQWTGTTSAEVW